MPALTTARRSELRAQAHGLSPVVMIGDKGLTDAIVAETDRALTAHELIKVKAASDDREARSAWMAELCERLGAQPVQSIGKILVLWRENPEKKEKAPAARPAPAPAKRKPASGRQKKKHRTAEELIRIERQRSRTPSPRPEPEPPRRRPRTSR
ncbi:MAG: YhbY family RNA-binding protein [Betaproteobacteria bacterium]|nr:YhbY family RNA-binding protein [Betaproteobacteria bacterium]PWB66692.1 MAG: ribosome assembly RNA-binding protein YhbY [Betaproteobacteria bacterium]